ncbi:Hydroxymethylglutaryl-CoA lyase YngG [Pigmentiphaga humi]|uniref:Hydroxymethylglutaryl-CoA lyase YngG n=1 Tax=Pigmentiphaga humi TaxID=2478468 RepID=A0A3P4B596_9BURK|nr:hydroxymethylglutaryl-CoA lyase [Pigmentiphaga humi]VCU71463.1 Hydroxymethylglutaryl-CoA lyase YngG [Pigmentiphaga humi]
MLPTSIVIHEEGPREGFQFERQFIATARKLELIEALAQTGLAQIQVVSFVNPKRVPNMADADEVVAALRPRDGVRYTGLWLNEQGLERALRAPSLTVAGRIGLCASAPFLARNQNATPESARAAQRRMAGTFLAHGIAVDQGVIQAAFGCNYAGDVPLPVLLQTIADLLDIAAERGERIRMLTLADTMAWATPRSIREIVGAVRDKHPDLDLVLHLHDTRGMGIANAYAGMSMGVRRFDAAVGGLGGCPFAGHKGAAGNVCTEDLVFMCDEMGIETGIDLQCLIEAARLAQDIVGHELPGAVMKGGALSAMRRSLLSAQ